MPNQNHRRAVLRNSLKAAGVYLVLGAAWIFFSDRFVEGMAFDPETLTTLQTYKGWFYVFLTALLAFFLWYRFQSRLEEYTARLKEEEALKHTTLQSIGDAVIATDSSQRITLLNSEASRLTGWGEEEARGRFLTEVFTIVHGDTRDPAENPADKVLRTGNVVGLANHTILIGRDGQEFQIADSGAPIQDNGGVIKGIVLVFRDVTSEYAMQAAIRLSEERLRLSLQAIAEGVWEMDPETGETHWSRFLFELLENRPSQTALNPLLNHIVEADLATTQSAFETLRKRTGESIDLKISVRTASRAIRWIRIRGSHIEAAPDKTWIYGTIADITDTRAMERRLQLTQFGIDHASIAIFQFNDEGRIYYANRHARESLGYAEEEITRLTVEDINPLTNLEDWKKHRDRVVEDGGSRRITTMHQHRDGHTFPVEVETCYSVFEGKLVSFSFVTDISERKASESRLLQLNEELREARDRAEASNRAKNEFLAVMSHEMRTPLNPVIGFASLLEDELSDDEHRSYVRNIITSSECLLRLIEDILTYVKLDRNTLKPEKEPFNLLALCQSVITDFQRQSAHVSLELAGPEDALLPVDDPLDVRGDENLLRSILENLISNACKFTREGSARLSLSKSASTESDGSQWFHFAVIDNGPGIDPGKIPVLFKPFEQLDSSNTREHTGIGLGLAICRKLVRLMGGEIGVDSRPGEGSRFWFRIPLQPLPAESLPRGEQEMGSGITFPRFPEACEILVVEDKPDNALIASTVLKNAGAKPLVVMDGRSALKACQERTFDLILMDISMPGMNGYETARSIIDHPGPNQSTPILALTAHVGSETLKRCRDAGMQRHIEKPIRPGHFLNTLQTFLHPDN